MPLTKGPAGRKPGGFGKRANAMARDHAGANIERSEYHGAMQRIIDALFWDAEPPARAACPDAGAPAASAAEGNTAARLGVSDRTAAILGLAAFDAPGADSAAKPERELEPTVRRLDVVIAAETADLPDELMRIVNLLPPGNYTRQRLCDQINSAITGHAWGQVYGTVS